MTDGTSFLDYGPETWTKGDRGQLSAHATDKPGLVNVRVYPDGSLGPRQMWDSVAFSTDTGNSGASFLPFNYGGSTPGFVECGLGQPKFYELDGTELAEASPTNARDFSARLYMSTIDDENFLVNEFLFNMQSTPTLPKLFYVTDTKTALDSTFMTGLSAVSIQGSTVHDGRAFYFGNENTGVSSINFDTIWYSDPYDYGAFASATQFFRVDGRVQGVQSVGSHLYIWTSEGNWYSLQGRGDPAKGTLTKLGLGRVPPFGRNMNVLDSTAIFLDTSKVTLSLLTTDGTVDDTSVAYLGDASLTGSDLSAHAHESVVNSRRNTAILSLDNNTARSLYNGVWTTETNNLGVAGTVAKFSHTLAIPGADTEALLRYEATDWDLYTRPTEVYEVYDGSARTEEASSVLTLPRIVDPGMHVSIKSLIIDYETTTGQTPSLSANWTGSINTTAGSSTDVQVDAESQLVVSFPVGARQSFADIEITFQHLAIQRVRVEYLRTQGVTL